MLYASGVFVAAVRVADRARCAASTNLAIGGAVFGDELPPPPQPAINAMVDSAIAIADSFLFR